MIAIFGRLAKYCYFCMFYIVDYISKIFEYHVINRNQEG